MSESDVTKLPGEVIAEEDVKNGTSGTRGLTSCPKPRRAFTNIRSCCLSPNSVDTYQLAPSLALGEVVFFFSPQHAMWWPGIIIDLNNNQKKKVRVKVIYGDPMYPEVNVLKTKVEDILLNFADRYHFTKRIIVKRGADFSAMFDHAVNRALEGVCPLFGVLYQDVFDRVMTREITVRMSDGRLQPTVLLSSDFIRLTGKSAIPLIYAARPKSECLIGNTAPPNTIAKPVQIVKPPKKRIHEFCVVSDDTPPKLKNVDVRRAEERQQEQGTVRQDNPRVVSNAANHESREKMIPQIPQQVCTVCRKTFLTLSQLFAHHHNTHSLKLQGCPFGGCAHVAERDAELLIHIKQAHAVPSAVRVCDRDVQVNMDAAQVFVVRKRRCGCRNEEAPLRMEQPTTLPLDLLELEAVTTDDAARDAIFEDSEDVQFCSAGIFNGNMVYC